MSRKLTLLLACVTIWSATACTGPSVIGSGIRASDVRALPAFDAIELRIAANAHVKLGGSHETAIEADDNILPLITTEVSNGRLVIASTSSFSTARPAEISIVAENLKSVAVCGSGDVTTEPMRSETFSVAVSGSGNVDISSIEAETLVVAIAGSGDVRAREVAAKSTAVAISGSGSARLAGSTDVIKVKVAGSGDVHAFDVSAKDASVDVSGSGDVRLCASEAIQASVAGSGDVYYKGTAKARVSEAGSGRVVRAD